MKDYEVFRQWLGNVMDFIYGPSHNWPFKALEKQKEWKEPKNHDFSYPTEEGKFEQGEIVYGEARPGEVKRFISNSDKMKSFGGSPEVGLEEGLSKYINWRKSL